MLNINQSMLNSENTIKTPAILLEDLIIQSYDETQHVIIMDLDLVQFYLNVCSTQHRVLLALPVSLRCCDASCMVVSKRILAIDCHVTHLKAPTLPQLPISLSPREKPAKVCVG